MTFWLHPLAKTAGFRWCFSMDWFSRENLNRTPSIFPWRSWGFPVNFHNFPLIQSIDVSSLAAAQIGWGYAREEQGLSRNFRMDPPASPDRTDEQIDHRSLVRWFKCLLFILLKFYLFHLFYWHSIYSIYSILKFYLFHLFYWHSIYSIYSILKFYLFHLFYWHSIYSIYSIEILFIPFILLKFYLFHLFYWNSISFCFDMWHMWHVQCI